MYSSFYVTRDFHPFILYSLFTVNNKQTKTTCSILFVTSFSFAILRNFLRCMPSCWFTSRSAARSHASAGTRPSDSRSDWSVRFINMSLTKPRRAFSQRKKLFAFIPRITPLRTRSSFGTPCILGIDVHCALDSRCAFVVFNR